MQKYSVYLDAALLAVVAYHLTISPYTKVEESFNIQAIHDMLNYGVYPQAVVTENYDHIKFPGVVPRTFVGSLLLAGTVKYLNYITKIVGYDLLAERSQSNLAGLVRGVLGLANVFSLIKVRNSINKINYRENGTRFAGLIGFFFSLLVLSQFHLLYYATRTLPNFIALPFALFGISKLIEGDISGLTWLAFTGIVFRLEVGLFAVITALTSSLIFGRSNIFVNILFLAVGTIIGGFVSFMVDSYFWNEMTLPELTSFAFNVVEGNASAWGVQPWSAYFNQYLWQLFRPPIVLILAIPGFISDPAEKYTAAVKSEKDEAEEEKVAVASNSLRILFVSSILYIAALSFQPHKEWRFIIYVVPIFILQAANGLTSITRKWSFSFMNKLFVILAFFAIFFGTVLSLLFGYISSYNYPGGDALSFVNSYIDSNFQDQSVLVHFDVAATISGINRFGELHDEYIVYDKTEGDQDLLQIWNNVQILVTESEIGTVQTAENSVLVYEPKNWKTIHKSPIFNKVNAGPAINLAIRLSQDSQKLVRFLTQVFYELRNGETRTLTDIIKSLVVTKDHLFVYVRVAKDEYPEIQRVGSKTPVEEFEEGRIHDIDPSVVKDAVNSEIDHLESVTP